MHNCRNQIDDLMHTAALTTTLRECRLQISFTWYNCMISGTAALAEPGAAGRGRCGPSCKKGSRKGKGLETIKLIVLELVCLLAAFKWASRVQQETKQAIKHQGMYQYVPACTCVHTSIYKHIPPCTCR
jgi:hypothetical protein